MKTELYSLKEKMVYREENAKIIKNGNIYILATPSGEPLVNRVR